MRGDQFNLRVSSWYRKNGVTPGTPISPLNALISSLISGVGGITNAAHGATPTQLQSSGVLIPGATSFYGSHNTADSTTKPKAFLNWIFLDDQFKYVGSGSGFQQVGADTIFTVLAQSGVTAAKNGFLYVYVSNETPNINVYFDNLQITHIKSPLLQEQSYYPFGLQMAGISDKALGKLDSKNKFNGGSDFEEDYGVNLYYTDTRKYDPQTGRFMGIDELTEYSGNLTSYQYAADDPIYWNDPSGLIAVYGGPPDPFHGMGYWGYVGYLTGYWFDNSGFYPGDFGGGSGGGGGGNLYSGAGYHADQDKEDPKPLDTKNGQVMEPQGWLAHFFFGDRIWHGHDSTGRAIDYEVDKNGYLTGKRALMLLMMPIIPDEAPLISLKELFNFKNFIKRQYVVYSYTKNGLPYIGKALGSLIKRYGSAEKVATMGAEVIKGLDNIPNNAIALGVEQIVMELNGGIDELANINNATIKEIYINEARYWLDENIPNWEEFLKLDK